MFALKKIEFRKKKYRILMQNSNGPCPLLGIGNVLILNGKLKMDPDVTEVFYEELVQRISEILFSMYQDPKHQQDGNFMQNLQDSINLFPKLIVGLDVNVKFQKSLDFEYTTDTVIFDLLQIRLFHGWLVNPDHSRYSIIRKYSYNSATEKILQAKQLAKSENKTEETLKAVYEGEILEDWIMNEAASQLTYQGIVALHNDMEEGELAVFFRNNHFSTILKRNKEIYLLVTDQGFLNEKRIVWEALNQIDGDSQWLDENFQLFSPGESDPFEKEDIEDSSALAKELQEKEDRKLAILYHNDQILQNRAMMAREPYDPYQQGNEPEYDYDQEQQEYKPPLPPFKKKQHKSSKQPKPAPQPKMQPKPGAQSKQPTTKPKHPSEDEDDCIIL